MKPLCFIGFYNLVACGCGVMLLISNLQGTAKRFKIAKLVSSYIVILLLKEMLYWRVQAQ